jgi:hypothetical protein
VISSETCFGTKFWEFTTIIVPRNGMLSWFLFRWMVWNRIPSVCFYFCSTDPNSELFSLPRNGSERNSESFLFRGTAAIPPEETNCSVYSVFRGIIFLSEIANPIVEGYGKRLEGKYRAMKGEIWVEWEGRENRLFCRCLRFSKYGKQKIIILIRRDLQYLIMDHCGSA